MKRIARRLALVIGFLLLSNRWLNWDAGKRFLLVEDVRSYELLAKSAPSLPAGDVPYHHAQRLFIHYIVGCFYKIFSLPIGVAYEIWAFLIAGAIVFVVDRILLRLKLELDARTAVLAVLLLNPYTFRYYFIVPGMIADLVFVLGLSITLLCLVDVSIGGLLAGLVLATLGRQAAILILPGILLWIIFTKPWQKFDIQKRLLICASSVVAVIGVYRLTGMLVLPFTGAPQLTIHDFDLMTWITGPLFTASGLFEHILRVFLPFCFPFALMIGAGVLKYWKRLPAEFWAGSIMFAATLFQPLMVNPKSMGHNESRHAGVGFVIILIMSVYVLRAANDQLRHEFKFGNLKWSWAFWICLGLSSLHHMFTAVSPFGQSQSGAFALLHIVAAMVGACAVSQLLQVRSSSQSA